MLTTISKKVKEKKYVSGLHILGEVYTEEIKKLNDVKLVKRHIAAIVKESNLHVLGSFYYEFPDTSGFTGLVSLAESHIAIHTWPEFGQLTLDIYLCHYSRDNSAKCKRIFDQIVKIFEPSRVVKRVIER